MDTETLNIFPIPVMRFRPYEDDLGNVTDLIIVWANKHTPNLFETSAGDIIDCKLSDIFPHLTKIDRLEKFLKTLQQEEGVSQTLEADEASPLKGRFFSYVCVREDDGCLLFMQDVSETFAERDAARKRSEMMEAACNDAVTGIAIAGGDEKMLYANPALCNTLGYSQEEIIGLHVNDLVHESEEVERSEMADKLVSAEIDQYLTDRTYKSKVGEKVLMSVAVSQIQGHDGEGLSLGHFRDVREERKAQAELQEALIKAEEATRLKSEFLANMSHEIRTPLNGVIGMAQVLSLSNLSQQQAENVAIIQESGTTLMTLLNDILDLSKVEAGKVLISPVETDLRHKLDKLYMLHNPIAEERGLKLNFACATDMPSKLMLDPVRVCQCVSNLVSNAIKFTSKGEVNIAVISNRVGAEYEITIHVSDTGIGIGPEKLDHVFGAFQQADGSTTRSYGGTGLGLAITRDLANLMGGDLSVMSELGRGSVFTLTFRAAAVEEISLPVTPERGNDKRDRRRDTTLSGRTVLVVDDNLINRQVALGLLSAYELNVETAVDGIDAVAKSKTMPFDIILMDIHMPNMDGVRATAAIRDSAGLNSDTPIIALTADAMGGDREKYLGNGMNGYVSKPIDERGLMTEIERAMTKSENRQEDGWSQTG